ncbi:MAG: DUF3592 domain-containing protein [Anaerolineales bacterium]
MQENYDSDGSTYTPVVHFKTSSGQSVEFVSSYSSNPPDYDVGEPVIVVHPPEDPQNAIIKGDGQFLNIIFMIVEGIVAAVGFYLLFSTFRALSVSGLEE